MAVQPARVATRPKIKYKPLPKALRPPPKKKAKPELTKEQIRALSVRRIQKIHRINPEMVNEAILKEHGLIMHIATRLRMPRTTITRYIQDVDVCREMLHYAREEMGDVAENKLFALIEQGDVRCILYYLSTVHRGRGYGVSNSDAPHSGANPVFVETVNIVGIPSGTFLPREIATRDDMVIEAQAIESQG